MSTLDRFVIWKPPHARKRSNSKADSKPPDGFLEQTSKQNDLAEVGITERWKYRKAALSVDDSGQDGTIDSMHRRFARVGLEIQMDSVVSPESPGDKRYSLRGQELAHERCIRVSNVRHFHSPEHVGSSKRLGDKSSAISAQLHQLVDEQFHRVDSIARIAFADTAIREQDMVHSAGTQDRVIQADGNTGTQQGVQDNGHLACGDFTDGEAYALAGRRPNPFRSRLSDDRRLRQIASDVQAMDRTALFCRARG